MSHLGFLDAAGRHGGGKRWLWLTEFKINSLLNGMSQSLGFLQFLGFYRCRRKAWRREAAAAQRRRLTGLGEKRTTPKEAGAAALRRDLIAAAASSFCGTPPEALPEVIRETEAEFSRRGRWQRAFPCPLDPSRHQVCIVAVNRFLAIIDPFQ